MAARTGALHRDFVSTRQAIDRWFYVGIASLTLALAIAGFAPALIVTSTRAVPLPLTAWVTAHALAATGWLVLFLVQSMLVAAGRAAMHRRLGKVGIGLAVLFVASGWFTVIEQARRGFDLAGHLVPPGTPTNPGGALSPLFSIALFAVLIGAALWYRRRPDVHKRLIVLAMIGSLSFSSLLHLFTYWPALAAPGVIISAWVLLLALLPIHDRFILGRIHPLSLWGSLGTFAWMFVALVAIAKTAAWNAFAAWMLARG